MLLRTRGRRSGLVREAPLGYVIRDGAMWCVAGYGETTPWLLNLRADPAVEVILPTRRFRGHAEVVGDPVEWAAAFRELIASFALVGRAVVGDVGSLDDAALVERYRALPIVRISPADGARLRPGPFDPGGPGWLVVCGFASAGIAAGIAAGVIRRATGRPGRADAASRTRPARPPSAARC